MFHLNCFNSDEFQKSIAVSSILKCVVPFRELAYALVNDFHKKKSYLYFKGWNGGFSGTSVHHVRQWKTLLFMITLGSSRINKLCVTVLDHLSAILSRQNCLLPNGVCTLRWYSKIVYRLYSPQIVHYRRWVFI